MSSYREVSPSAPLRSWIECFWYRKAQDPDTCTHRVLPDGCIDIIFNFGDELEQGDSGRSIRNIEKAYVVGTMTRPIHVRLSGQPDLLGSV